MKNPILIFAALLFAFQFNPPSHAGVIQGVSIQAVYSEFTTGATDQRRATNIINGNGLYGDIHAALGPGNVWLTLATTSGDYSNAFVTFDLGSTRTLSGMRVWNYNEAGANTQRGIQRADISVSTDGVNFTTNFPNTFFNRAPGVFSNYSQTISLGGVSARYVSLKVITNHYVSGTAEPRVGLCEVQFIDDSVPPIITRAARSYLGTNVTVRFSESVLAADALNPANYHIILDGTNAATVLGASFNTYNDSVNLQTTPLASNLVYSLSATNIRDAASVISITNTLVTIVPQLAVWLKADAGVIADGSGNVSQWNDQSGLGNNASAGTNAMPILSANVVNGQPAIHFDGTAGVAQALEIPDNPTINIKRDLTLYLVMSIDTTVTPIHCPISKCNVNQPASFDLQIAVTSGKPSLVRGNGAGSQAFASSGAGLAANQFYVVTVVMRGTNISHYLNGNFSSSGTSLAGIGDTGTPIRFGVRADGGTRLRGNLAEVMVFNGAVSDGDQAAVDNYLGTKYGISIVPLAIISHPQNATRFVGQTATFGVSAIAGSPNIFYQWQSNNVNIVNATNSIYITPALTLAASNSVYRVFVRTPLNITNISNGATLSVLPDTQSPTLFSATRKAGSATDVVVVFSESVATAGATNLANYALDNGVIVNSAVVGTSSNQVVLTTSGLNAGTTYVLSVQNVQDLFSNVMAPAAAQILPANMSLWVRANSGIITNDSGLVLEWDDQTANQNNALQYSGTFLQPAFVADAMNGQPALRFDGGSNYLQAASSPSLAITGDITIYAVVNFTDFAAGRQILGKTLVNQPAPYDYYVPNATSVRLLRGNGTVNGSYAPAVPAISAGAPHVLVATTSGTAYSHYIDGALFGPSAAISTTIADAGTPLRIGSRGDLLQYMKGDIAEILIFNSALSASERTVVNNYLGAKYLPFAFTLQPTNDTKLQGQTATFYVAASQGGATLNYQWQRYGTNLIGATSPTYTTPALTLADDQSTYRALVWVTGTTTNTSDTATLSILVDDVLPTVLSAGRKIWSQSEIVVLFSEAVSPTSATNAGNYLLDSGATVTSATMDVAANRVLLTTTGITNGGTYMLTIQNVKDLFNNTMTTVQVPVGYYPTPLALWLKADAGVIADSLGQVSEWDDQSGNTNNTFQPNGPPFVPTVSTNGFNGLTSIHFSGSTSTNYLLTAAAPPSLSLLADMSIYAVSRFDDFTPNNGIVSKTTGVQPNPFDFYLVAGTGRPRFLRGNGIASQNVTGLAAPTLGVPHIVSVIMQPPVFQQGSSVAHFLDGATNGTGVINTTIGDFGDPVGIGSRGDLGTHMSGDFAEIMIFGSALSDADRQALDNYLSVKYNIVVGSLPRISIGTPAGGDIALSWPTPTLNFALESATDLSAPVWSPVSVPVVSSGGTNTATISVTNSLQFFRLHKQ